MPDVTLRPITLDDCTQKYVDWLNDPLVNRWLETRHRVQTMETITDYVKYHAMFEPATSALMAIMADGKHVGNIKVGEGNAFHQYGFVSYFIGDRSVWGRGIATQAVRKACDMAFKKWGYHSLQAGVYRSNYASRKVLLKAGFSHVGTYPRQLLVDGKREDHDFFSLVNDRQSL